MREESWHGDTKPTADGKPPITKPGPYTCEEGCAVPFPGTAKMRRMMPWHKMSMKNAAAALTARGSTTSPPTARPPTSSAPRKPLDGAAYLVTTAISTTRCRTPVLMEGDANTPMHSVEPLPSRLADRV
jgi:hypothetical protein